MHARTLSCGLAAALTLVAVSAAPASANVSPGDLLAGTYAATLKTPPAAKGLWAFSIAASGEYAIAYKSKVVVRGKATIGKATIVFGARPEQGALACKGKAAKATYAWTVKGAWLALTPRPADACSGRRLVLARALKRAR
jgi:hypothetical protein